MASAGAQTKQDVLIAIRKDRLSDAVAKASMRADAKEADAGDFQVQGLLFASEGRMREAVHAFQRGLKIAKPTPTTTGLEELPPNNELMRKLSRIKGSFAPSNAPSAFHNNIGLASLLLGQMKTGFDELAIASQIAPRYGPPYVNEAVGHLLKAEGSKAVNAAKKAARVGDSSVMARTVLAEADLSVNRTQDAWDQLKLAMEEQPEHPVALSVRAKYASRIGDARSAQRFRAKALVSGAPLAVDGAVTPTHTFGRLSGGSAKEQHYLLDQKFFKPGGFGATIFASGDQGRVQDRGTASQSLTDAHGEIANEFSSVHFDYKGLAAGRPGVTTFEPGVISDPNANLAFHQSNLFGTIKLGPVLFEGRYRASNANVSDVGASSLSHDNDSQLAGEARYDLNKWGGKTVAGVAISHLNRNLTNQLAIDPTEQLLPNGRTDQWTSYLMHTRDLGSLFTLSVGGEVGRNGIKTIAQPFLDLKMKLSQAHVLSLGIKSEFNSDTSDLMPEEMRPPQVLENNIDRNQDTTTPYNRAPVLLTQEGRQQSVVLGLRSQMRSNLGLKTEVYHHEMKDVAIQGTDPQTATYLNQNLLAYGRSTGMSETARWTVGSKTALRVHGYAQSTHMVPKAGLYNGTTPGAPVPVDLPYFPNVGLDVGLDFQGTDWTGTLVASTLGRRTVATAVPLPGNQYCCSYIQVRNPITAWNLFVHKQAGKFEAYAAIYNITRVSFYPGDPGRTTVVIGLQL